MESIFDVLQEAAKDAPDKLKKDAKLQQGLELLVDYYENGQWLSDYESDERGELPTGLKRGVLSEDGVYNLLEEIRERGF